MGKQQLKHVRSGLTPLALGLVAAYGTATAAAPSKPRVVVLSDIGNEPDDSESFVRFLLYTNQFDVEGLVATTSTWQRDRVQPQLLRQRIDAYGKVLPNLRRHAAGYPEAAELHGVVREGSAQYGMAGVGDGRLSEGAKLIISVVDRPDERPVYVSVWGGAADLAQALWTVRATRSPEQVKAFVAKLRVYSISDQDDAGPWLRRNFADLFWIASIHGWGQYPMATWVGISGDLPSPVKWPASDMVTNEWIEKNIRRGTLGALYPPHAFLMEGDTPAFLGLIGNGLNDPEHPEWGSWGGRYLQSYEGGGHWGDAQDFFADDSGKPWFSNQATVFRWRQAFQNDFAARIAWTLPPSGTAFNHNPDVVVNKSTGNAALRLTVRAGETVNLSAAGTRDRDGNVLRYRWWQYGEASGAPSFIVPKLAIAGAETAEASFIAPTFRATADNVPAPKIPLAHHVVLEVTDSGSPALTSYRRIVVTVAP